MVMSFLFGSIQPLDNLFLSLLMSLRSFSARQGTQSHC